MTKFSEELQAIQTLLQELLELYNKLINNKNYCTPKIIKNTQDSIKELCDLIVNKTSD